MAEGANKWPGVGWVVTIPCSNHGSNHDLEGHMKGFNYYPETNVLYFPLPNHVAMGVIAHGHSHRECMTTETTFTEHLP